MTYSSRAWVVVGLRNGQTAVLIRHACLTGLEQAWGHDLESASLGIKDRTVLPTRWFQVVGAAVKDDIC